MATMDNSAHPVTPPQAIAANAVLCGPAPLVPGEDPAAYDELLARATALVAPGDVLEELWVRDVVNRVWDTARLHRMKANLLTACASVGLKLVLDDLGWATPLHTACEWARRSEETVATVETALAGAGLS